MPEPDTLKSEKIIFTNMIASGLEAEKLVAALTLSL
jgi:hypothetical protein